MFRNMFDVRTGTAHEALASFPRVQLSKSMAATRTSQDINILRREDMPVLVLTILMFSIKLSSKQPNLPKIDI